MYSLRDMAYRTGLGTSTVSALVYGRRQSDERTLNAAAGALRLPVTTIRGWASEALGEAAPFELPQEANRLTRREREAVLAVVRAMLDPQGQSESQPPAVAPVRELHPPAPDLTRVAARRGKSTGQQQRADQDKAAEETQDPSHEPHS